MLELMGLNFQNYDGVQPKMRAGMIKLHECRLLEDSHTVWTTEIIESQLGAL